MELHGDFYKKLRNLSGTIYFVQIYEHYTENNPVEKNTVAGKAAKEKEKEKELEEWLRDLEGMRSGLPLSSQSTISTMNDPSAN